MKFLLDENIGKRVARFLRNSGHSTIRIKEIAPGIEDFKVLSLSFSKNAILVTSDKDFGELVFKYKQPHTGIILLRIQNQSSFNKIRVLNKLFSKYMGRIEGNFVVINEKDDKINIKIK